jgi:starvation-inducible DNA-binding protein
MEVIIMSKKAQATVKADDGKRAVARRQSQPKSQGTRFKTSNDLSQDTRAGVVELLNARLADCFDLYSHAKQAHWNVKGHKFTSLHELFDDIAESLEKFGDEIAERAVTLGGYANGTVRMASSASQLPEYPTDAVDGFEHLDAMIERVSMFGRALRQSIDRCDDLDDDDTQDMLVDISRAIDKHLWFLEAHNQADQGMRDGGDAKFAARRSKR